MTSEGALSGIKVLDLTWVLSGPYASMILCDLGAEVIKVEKPPYGDVSRTSGPHINGESSYFFSINRGKKSILIDFKREQGRELFRRMAAEVDVVMENFTPGTMDRLGVGYEALSAINPRLIYAATSGFGQTGPDRMRPALDIVVQGMGGVMSITGEPGGEPVRPGLSLGDIAAGLYTAIGILAALQERERSGKGQLVDISMLDCQIAILENAYARYSATGVPPKALGTRHPIATPFQAFPTQDGYLVLALAFGQENAWQLFCGLIGHPELMDDPRFATPGLRTKHHDELEPILNAAMRKRPTHEWLTEFDAMGFPCGPLNTIPEAAAHRQVQAREMLVEVESERGNKLTISNSPLRLSRTPGHIRGGPPTIGRDTRAVLESLLGLSPADVDALFASGIAVEGQDIPSELTS
ncbi:MAG TPA: CaiB/BaiF CoA-transferase family protein [Dehalococcoidia bacterium]